MVTKFIEIPEEKWGCLLVWNFDVLDYDDIWAICRSFGMSDRNTKKSLQILSTYNSGMTISNFGLRMSAVFIGHATSCEQFLDTIAHECVHVCQAILDYYDENWEGETPAYLDGYLFKQIVATIGVPCK